MRVKSINNLSNLALKVKSGSISRIIPLSIFVCINVFLLLYLYLLCLYLDLYQCIVISKNKTMVNGYRITF